MGKSSRFLIVSITLFVGLWGLPAASDVPVALKTVMNQYIEHLAKGHQALKNYNYDQAITSLKPAIQTYHSLLDIQAQECECGSEEAYDIRMLAQSHLMRYIMQLGQRLFDQERFTDALTVYTHGQTLNPEYPCLRYEKGFTYFAMKDFKQAAVEIYEAKRLVRFPDRRNIVDSHAREEGVYCHRPEVDHRSDDLLKKMNFATDYPLDWDLINNKHKPGQIVPGLGVNIQWQEQSQNVYLQDSLKSVLTRVGKPQQIFEKDLGGKTMIYVQYGGTTLAFDQNRKRLQSIQLNDLGRSVLTPAGYIEIGSSAREVLAKLKQDYGLIQDRNKDPNNSIREVLYYAHLGLSFLIGPKDTITYINVYSLEEELEKPAGTFSALFSELSHQL